MRSRPFAEIAAALRSSLQQLHYRRPVDVRIESYMYCPLHKFGEGEISSSFGKPLDF